MLQQFRVKFIDETECPNQALFEAKDVIELCEYLSGHREHYVLITEIKLLAKY